MGVWWQAKGNSCNERRVFPRDWRSSKERAKEGKARIIARLHEIIGSSYF